MRFIPAVSPVQIQVPLPDPKRRHRAVFWDFPSGVSRPAWATWPVGQVVKTPPFHGGNTGSSPVGVIQTEVKYRFCFFITYLLLRRVVRVGRRSTPGKCVGVTSVSRVRIPHSPLFAYTSLNLVKQNVDLTGFCYILLIFVEPRNST